jgi:large subunit ribosomal protein L16
MLQPARRKYRKEQKGRQGVATAEQGQFWRIRPQGLGREAHGALVGRAAATTRHRAAVGFDQDLPDKPISQARRSADGQRQGQPGVLVAEIQPGKVLYEMDGVDETVAREAFALAAAKLPIRTTFVHRLMG